MQFQVPNYDMDTDDEQFLEAWNENTSNTKNKLTCDTVNFERIMDRVEMAQGVRRLKVSLCSNFLFSYVVSKLSVTTWILKALSSPSCGSFGPRAALCARALPPHTQLFPLSLSLALSLSRFLPLSLSLPLLSPFPPPLEYACALSCLPVVVF